MTRRSRRWSPSELLVDERTSVPVSGDHDDERWRSLRRPLALASSSYYASMLYQDLYNQIIPFRAREIGYQVVLEPDNAEELRALVGRGLEAMPLSLDV